MDQALYSELNKAWKATCKILLGEEVGEFKDFEPWLAEFYNAPRLEKSAISGKEIYMPVDDYCKGARFIGLDEVNYGKKFESLNINEIKDIDGIIDALRERFYYTGNVVLGNSKFVERSSSIGDSYYVYDSALVDESKYVTHTKWYRYGQYVFGVNNGSASEYCIKGHLPTKSHRCFDVYVVGLSKDIYYSANLTNCSECLFSFNLQNAKRTIGNLELPADQYATLKKKLVSEMAGELKSKKRLPSLFELMSEFKREQLDLVEQKEERCDIEPIEDAFEKTYKLILKKEPGPLESYREFLSKRGPRTETLKGTSSKGDIIVPSISILEKIPINKMRFIRVEDSIALSEKKPALSPEEVQKLSLKNISALSKIAFVSFNFVAGNNRNVSKSVYYAESSDCYAGFGYREAKMCAYSFWPRESQYIFGSSMALSSSFCINAYYSKKMTRAFEVDNCNGCSDIYFSHNCENIHEAMFCFNAKNLTHSIGNTALQPSEYNSVKKSIIDQVADELEKKKKLRFDIFTIGCYRK